MGVRKRRCKDYYQNLLAADSSVNTIEQEDMQHVDDKGSITESIAVVEKWKGQIEKVVLENLFSLDPLYLVVQRWLMLKLIRILMPLLVSSTGLTSDISWSSCSG